MFSFQLGIALGFVLPAKLVADQDLSENYGQIGQDLFFMFLGVAIFTTVLLLSIIFGKKCLFFCQIFVTFFDVIIQFLPVWISINARNNWKISVIRHDQTLVISE